MQQEFRFGKRIYEGIKTPQKTTNITRWQTDSRNGGVSNMIVSIDLTDFSFRHKKVLKTFWLYGSRFFEKWSHHLCIMWIHTGKRFDRCHLLEAYEWQVYDSSPQDVTDYAEIYSFKFRNYHARINRVPQITRTNHFCKTPVYIVIHNASPNNVGSRCCSKKMDKAFLLERLSLYVSVKTVK